MRTRHFAALAALALSSMTCQPPVRPTVESRQPTSAAGTSPAGSAPASALPAGAKLSLADVPPPLSRVGDPPNADQLGDRAREIVEQAEQLLAQREYTRAIAMLDRAKGFAPGSARILRDLGFANADLGDRAKAEPALREAAKASPDHVRIHLLLGTYNVMDRVEAQAITDFRRGLLCGDAGDDNPDTGDALYRLAMALEQRGYLTAALECYRRLGELVSAHGRAFADRPALRALVTQPESILVAQGKVLLRLEQPEQAAVPLEQAYRRDKTHADAGLLAVRALVGCGKFERAQSIVLEMLQDQHRAAAEAARDFARQRKDPKAIRGMLAAYTGHGGKDPNLIITLAEVAAELGDSQEAADILARHLPEMPRNRAMLVRLIRLCEKAGKYEQAAHQLASLLLVDDVSIGQLKDEARVLARQSVKKDLAAAVAAAGARTEGKLRWGLLCVAGLLAGATDDAAQAKNLFRQVITAEPQFWPAYEALQDMLAAEGDYEAVDKLAADVNRAAGDSFFWFYLVGKSQATRGETGGTIVNLEQARARNGKHVATLLLLGQAYYQSARPRDAEKALLAAFSLAGDDVEVNRALFDFYRLTRKPQEAEQVVAHVLQNEPKSIPGRVMLARLCLSRGDAARARAVLKELLAEAPDDVDVRLLDVQGALPENLTTTMPADRAKPILDKLQAVLRLDRDNLNARQLYAAMLSNQGRDAEAVSAWEPLYRQSPNNVRVVAGYVAALIKAKMNDRIVAVARGIAARKDAPAVLRELLSDSLIAVKQYAEAEAVLENWIASLDQRQEYDRLEILRFRVLEVYERAEHYDKAQKLLDEWIASGPQDKTLRGLRAWKLRLYGKVGKLDEAVACAGKLLENDPENEGVRLVLLAVLVEAKQFDRAQQVLDKWLADKTLSPDLLRGLKGAKLDIYARQGQFDQLQAYGQAWIQNDPDSDQPYRAMLLALTEQKKLDAALKLGEEWLAKRLKSPAKGADAVAPVRIRGLIVDTLLRAERKKDALDRVGEWVKADPNNVELLKLQVIALRAMDKEDEVVGVMEKILQLDPADPGTNNDLGYSYADRGVNLDKAEQMIRKALVAEPNSVAVRDSFGWVLYKQGKFEEAKRVFDQIVPSDAEKLHAIILEHAGDVCWRLGLKDEAVGLWERALDMARKGTRKDDSDNKKVLDSVPAKLDAVRGGKPPKVAPLGKGVPEPAPK